MVGSCHGGVVCICSWEVRESHHLLSTTSDRHEEDLVETNSAIGRVPVHSQRGHGGVGHLQVLHSAQWS